MIPISTGIYIRVSTEDQVKEGFSISAQKEKLTKYAQVNDWGIFDYYIDDGISGKNIKDRPELTRLIESIKKKEVNNILVYKLDRLTRSVKDLVNLIELFEKCECTFSSLTEKLDTSNAVGRMFIKIIGIFAEFERENLAERVSFGYEEKTRQGNYTNTNGVYGYNYIAGIGKLEVNTDEAKLVNFIYDLYLSNNSMLSISKLLNEKKVQTKRGGQWRSSTIRSILTNPLYIGKVRYGVSTKNKHKAFLVDNVKHLPIIDKIKYDNVQKMMLKRTKFKAKRYSSDNTYFFHVLKCGYCGSKMHAKQQIQSNTRYITYICNGRRNGLCTSQSFSHQKLERVFIDYLDQLQSFVPDDTLFVDSTSCEKEKDKQKILREINKLNVKKNETRDLFLNGVLLFEEYEILMKRLEDKLEVLKIKFQNDTTTNIEKTLATEAKKIIGNVKLNWGYLNNREKKTFLERFIRFIEVKKELKKVEILNIEFDN